MKRAIALLLLLALCTFAQGQTVQDYAGQSASQLSAMTDYVTIPNTSYWNTHAYLQLKTLFGWVVPVDLVTDIYGSVDTLYYIMGGTNDYPLIKGMVDVNDPKYIFIPPSVTLSANRNYVHNGEVKSLIDVSATHDVVITGGGTLYGKSDSTIYNNGQTEYDCGIEVKSSQRVLIDGMNIRYPSGDGVGVGYVQFPTYNETDTSYYLVESDGVTIRNTSVYCPTIKHYNHPVNEQTGRNAIAVTGAKNVVIDGCYLYGGIPAVIDVEGNTSLVDTVENLIITNCVIDGLSKGRYTVGAVVNDSSFYLKSINSSALSIAADSLVGLRLMSADYGVVASKFGGSVNDWQTIASNTATSGGSTTITVSSAWATTPTTSHYVVIYNFSGAWPVLPDSTMIFGDGHVTAYGTYTVTVTGITATLNQLAGYKLYMTTNPIGCIARTISANEISAGDSVLIELDRSMLKLTPVRGAEIGLGDSYGSGILVHGRSRYKNIIIANNLIKNCYGYGIRIQQGGTDSTHKVLITGNRFENCLNKAIEVTNSLDVKISNNSIYNSTIGINDLGASHHTIENNTIKGCPLGAIWVLGSPGNDSTGTLVDINVLNNHSIDCGSYTTPPARSIWLEWTKNSAAMGNVIYNSDTNDSLNQAGMYLSYCKNLYIGDNTVSGYNNYTWTMTGCTFRNTAFSYLKRKFGINTAYPGYTFVVRDSVEQTGGGLAWQGGKLYPESTNPNNYITINGSTLVLCGGTHTVLSVPDTAGTKVDLVVASINASDTKTVVLKGNLLFPDIVKSATYDATSAGDIWINTSHDTLWYSTDGTNAAFILIDGYTAKH
jgi:hypothetical protein